ncbi:Dyp-type peroxidase [Methylobacterium radiodurans]|nr:Dyp-type peroxidase [Methylobacterium radiodurans]
MSVAGITPSNANVPKQKDPHLRECEIQGDIIVGLQKDEEVFVFFKILDARKFRKVLRERLTDRITTTSSALARELQVKAYKREGHRHRLPLIGINIGFTHAGLETLLGAAKCTGMDPSFMAGAAAQAAALSDPVDANGNPVWKPAFASDTIHGVLLVAGPAREVGQPGPAETEASAIVALFGNAVAVVDRETGITRPQRGHEHFGFLDGISNPGVRGITPRTNPENPNQGVPGQDLLWPGAFVFGYPGQDPDKPFEEPGPEPHLPHPWMRDGSYMVFRRLNQRVPEFHAFLDAQAAALGTDPALLGARMVGRWQSGAPVMLAPLQDDPLLGADPARNNAFEFSQDKAQRRCPYGAHIRKTYPRDDLKDPGTLGLKDPEGFVQAHRIMRQGIPFGPEVDEATEETTTVQERGLMFVCYQTSIVEQFEFIQKDWSNAPSFPPAKMRPGGGAVTPGHDPIIGQAGGPRQMDEPLPNYPTGSVRSTLDMPEPFVVPTAAGYFFMPSLTALKTM